MGFHQFIAYSGSSVGYLAAVVKTTNIEGILQIDLNKTDFYGQQTIPTFLYYNPTLDAQLVNLDLPAGTFDMYDAITENNGPYQCIRHGGHTGTFE